MKVDVIRVTRCSGMILTSHTGMAQALPQLPVTKKNKKNRQFFRGESYSTLWILTSYSSGRIILIKSTRKEFKAIVLVNKRISQDVGCLSHLLQKTLNDCATL